MTNTPSDPIQQWRRHQHRRRALGLLALLAGAGAVYGVWDQTRPEPVYRLLYLPRLDNGRATEPAQPRPAAPPAEVMDSGHLGDSGDSGSQEWTLAEQRIGVVEAVEDVRAAGTRCGGVWHAPSGPLRINRALERAAQAQAVWMVEADDFAHHSPDNPAGATPMERAERAGFSGYTVGENLAWGQSHPAAAVQWWEHSTTHCQILMAADLNAAGVGVVVDPAGGWVWVLLLGTE